jgi:hypothetical protein
MIWPLCKGRVRRCSSIPSRWRTGLVAFGILAAACLSWPFAVMNARGQSQVRLFSLTPDRGPVGTKVLLRGTGFTETANTVHFGPGSTGGLSSSQGGTRITYVIPESAGPCDQNPRCMLATLEVTPGLYPIYVSNVRGSSNALAFEVTQ